MIKIITLSDTHIRNLKYHDEYRQVFKQIFKILEEEKPDYIVHCGDIAHTKTSISPEFVEMCAWFLNSLANIAPTYIILGNHDGNLKNSTRQDSITPIVSALNNPNLHLFKNSGEYLINDKLTFGVLSIFDEDNWKKPSDKSKINIALYHGAIAGVATDIGYNLEHSDHDISIFEDFDYAFLGDIHKSNQIVDTDGRVRYTGSTTQQNHAESDDKGFLIWEIEDKSIFNVRHIIIPNPRPFVTIKLDIDGKFDNSLQIKPGAYIRVVGETNLALHDVRKAIDIIKLKFNPESVCFLNKAIARTDISSAIQKLDNENLQDPYTQECLLREYLKDYNPTEEILNKIFDINKKFNIMIEDTEEISRNVRWSLKSVKWDNLFNYGENNSIDFEKLNGVVGVFGKNFCGKTSIFESFLWGMQNSTSKNIRKNINIINQNKDNCKAIIDIIVDNKQYTIERTAEKYIKKIGGEEILEAKTDVSFTVCDSEQPEDCNKFEKGNLNGLDRNETDRNIRKIFGTLEDFLFTSMASQMGSLDFINEGSTRRKEILGKFLDLEGFAKKYKLSNDEAVEIKSSLKRLETRDYDKEILEGAIQLIEIKSRLQIRTSECNDLKEDIKNLSEQINKIDIEVASLPKIEVTNLEEANKDLAKLNKEVTDHTSNINELNMFISTKQVAIDNATKLLNDIKINDLNARKSTLIQKNKDLDMMLRELISLEKDLIQDNDDVKILKEVPCGDKYLTSCKFLINAYQTKENIPAIEVLVDIARRKKKQTEDEIIKLKPSDIEQSINTHNIILDKKRNMEYIISSKRLESEKIINKIILTESNISKLKKNIEDYHKNEEVAIKLKDLFNKKLVLNTDKKNIYSKLTECEASTQCLYKEYGSLEHKQLTLDETKSEMLKVREQYAAIAMFEKAMHSNGISYDIIRKKLPIINEEIAKILANIVNFEIFFEDDGKKLEINIKHPKYGARPIELCSGAEKSLAAMAIRLVLTKITSLPVCDLIILDEPATSLDEENMEGFIRILDMLKSQYKTIILISHLTELKDVVDSCINIDNINGYANINL